jgi:hypothetical protein
MKQLLTLVLGLWLCAGGPLQAEDDDSRLYEKIAFKKVEQPVYAFAKMTSQVVLPMEYAQAEIGNTGKWLALADRSVAYEIDLVFTKYPRDITAWRTNYHQLLNERLRALFALDPNLERTDIRWNMVLQTQCKNEEEAKTYFHGFVIKYRPKRLHVIDEVKSPQQLRAIISGHATTRDSTVLHILERHPEWNQMLVIMDWTGSMYQYGAQLVLWHKLNFLTQPDRVKHFVFFNDGNSRKSWQKRIGRTGGVYRAKNSDITEIVETMEYVMKKGNGGDSPENDLEAVLTGIQYLEGFQEVILIADNKSDVRDIELLKKINRPVRVIICDQQGSDIHPHYRQIAEWTGGSIHTLTEDLERLQTGPTRTP